MVNRQTRTSAFSFARFIKSNDICVLYAGVVPGFNFNKYLQKELAAKYGSAVSTGTINLKRVDYSDQAVREFVMVTIPKLGLKQINQIHPGYYLFKKGIAIAYHSGSPDFAEMEKDRDLMKANFLFSVWKAFEYNSLNKGVNTFLDGASAQAAKKIFTYFQDCINLYDSNSSGIGQNPGINDELLIAYMILCVKPEATDEEIHKSWRKLMAEYHPDKDMAHSKERTQLCTYINTAYERIKKAREGVKAKN